MDRVLNRIAGGSDDERARSDVPGAPAPADLDPALARPFFAAYHSTREEPQRPHRARTRCDRPPGARNVVRLPPVDRRLKFRDRRSLVRCSKGGPPSTTAVPDRARYAGRAV